MKATRFSSIDIGTEFKDAYGDWYWKRTEVEAESQMHGGYVNIPAEAIVYIYGVTR